MNNNHYQFSFIASGIGVCSVSHNVGNEVDILSGCDGRIVVDYLTKILRHLHYVYGAVTRCTRQFL